MKAFNNTVGSRKDPVSSKRILQSQVSPPHNDYGSLSKVVSKQLKKKKRKESIQLQLEMENTIRRQIQNQQRCHSMDRLVTLNREKNEEIKRYIYQKAALESKNQELKVQMMNPSQREVDLQRKINELEVQIVKMRSSFEQRELKYKQTIEELKRQHRRQMNETKDKYQYENNRLKMISRQQQNDSHTLDAGRRERKQLNVSYERGNSGSRVVNVHQPNQSVVHYVTRDDSPRKSQYQNLQTIPAHNSTYNNVFTQSNYIQPTNKATVVSNTVQSYTSSIMPNMRTEVGFSQKDRNYSPNSTKNTSLTTKIETASHINPVRVQMERTGLTSSPQKNKIYQYRNVNEKIETINNRPSTFGNNESVPSIKISNPSRVVNSSDIDDIYKRYYLND